MSHSVVTTNSSRYPAEIVFSDFKVTGLLQYGPPLKRKFPKTCIKVMVGSEQSQQTDIATRSSEAQWDKALTFAASKPDEQVTVMILQVAKDLSHTCLASYSGTVAKLGPSGQEFSTVLQTQKKYNVTLSFRYDNISNADHPHARIFALIIGINKYKHKKPLEGSVRDATEFKNYLSSELDVPDANMRFLTDRAATRDRILEGFQWLMDHPRIQPGDAIIVYYAGHGSRAKAPDGWFAEGGKVETICPIDEQEIKNGKPVHGIPDRTIGGLLKRLSDRKGNNITVIFDCCHSGGLSRGIGTDTKLGLARQAEASPYPLPSDLDKDILEHAASRSAATTKVNPGFRQALSTYVLLAACRPDEQAWETVNHLEQPCGIFTYSLIQNLRELRSSDTTYADLMETVTVDLRTAQSPQCEGQNKDRILFDGRAPKKDPNAYMLKQREDDDDFEVAVGEIHGLCAGAIFSIRAFDAKASAYYEIGLLEAKAVFPQKAILSRIPGTEYFEPYFGTKAVVKSWNSNDYSLPVFIQDEPGSQPIAIAGSPDSEPRFRRVSKKDDAELVVRRTGPGSEMVTFDRLKGPIAEHAERSPRRAIRYSPTRLEEALDAISHFNYHLGRSNPATTIKPDDIQIRFHCVKEVDFANSIYGIDGQDLMQNGMATVPPSIDRWYGFTIENWTEYDLYVYLFWFDPAEYSIDVWYDPPSLTMAPPLPRAQRTGDGIKPTKFGIGYGSSTTDPFEFSLTEGEKRDTGFLKLYVSTRCVDMKFIEQTSPLGEMARSTKLGPATTRQVKREEAEDMWASFVATVVVSEDAK